MPQGNPIGPETLAELVQSGLSIRQIAAELDRTPAAVRHWLGRHELGTRGRPGPRTPVVPGDTSDDVVLNCRVHGLTVHRPRGDGGGLRCLRCRSAAVKDRRRKVKAILVDEAGGCCVVCGYDRCLRALGFHHVDPARKTFGLGFKGATRSLDRSRAEMSKCVLLCSNCHMEVEAGVRALPAMNDRDRARQESL